MLRTGNASLRPREMALPGKRRAGIAPRRIKNSGFCRFLSPCFATGCHTFGFKIATAAKRPRNDTKLERFNLENGRFSIFAVIFCAVLLCTAFQTFRSGNCSVSPQNPPDLSLRGGRVRPTRQSLTERFAIPKRTMVARNETKPWKEERGSKMKQGIHVFVTELPSCFVLPCFATGCHAFGFQIATAALRPCNDTKNGRFCNKTYHFYSKNV